MQRRVLLLLGVILCVPASAQALVTITAGNHVLLAGTAGQVIKIMISADEDYTASNARTNIEALGPQISHINGKGSGAMVAADMAGTVFAGGSGGINGTPPNGTTTGGDPGRSTAWANNAAGVQQTSGIYAFVTVSTVGIAAGIYDFTLDMHEDGPTDVENGIDEDGFPIGPSELVLENGSLTVVPEPGSVVLGLFAAAGLATVAVRRHRARRAA